MGDLLKTHIETARLILRPHIWDDFEDYFGYIMEPELQQMLGLNGVDDRDSAKETFQWLLDNTEFIALVSKDSGKAIGHICIQRAYESLEKDPGLKGRKGGSLSFAIAGPERRKGLMLEALRGLVDRLFQTGAVDYIDCEYELANTASRALQEKLGFQYWGTEQFEDVELIINILRSPIC